MIGSIIDSEPLILVAENDPQAAAQLRASFEEAGFSVLEARDGIEVVDVAAQHEVDAIVLDLQLARRDGLETCRALKARADTQAIPVVFIANDSATEKTLRAFEAGGSDFISKPLQHAEVLARVSVHVRLRRAEAELYLKNQQSEVLARKLADINLKLTRQSQIDPLTEVLNRRVWEEILEHEHGRYQEFDKPYSIVMIDIDFFKGYNDSQGHQAGDECLRRTVAAITHSSRNTDFVGRYGGEEFVVLASETEAEAALKLAERIRQSIWSLAIPHPASGVANRITASIGTATSSSASSAYTLRRADEALYIAKRAGRNMVYCIDRAGPNTGLVEERATPALLPIDDENIVLVVDDDEATRNLLSTYLRADGYTVHQACDGLEALDRVAELQPHVVLMDVVMPRLDGIECTRKLRQDPRYADIAVIMASAHGDDSNVLAALQAGAEEYLVKPVRAQELLVRVKSMVRLQRERRDLLQSYQMRGERVRVLRRVIEFCRDIGACRDETEALDLTLAVTREVTRSQRVSIMLPDEGGQNLVVAASCGIDADIVESTLLPIGEAVAGKVYATAVPIVVNDEIDADAQCDGYDSRFFASLPLLVTPLAASGERIGVLSVTDRDGALPFKPDELEYVELIGKITAVTLNGLQKRMSYRRACDAITVALAKLAEHRDDDTGRHLERVTAYAVLLAEQLQTTDEYRIEIDDAFLDELCRAVPLHDIGKVAIPDHILRKPGTLDRDETAVMRTHAQIGAETIRAIVDAEPAARFLHMALDIAGGHHEWYDGTGYPFGRKGKAIPLAARLVALADVYDALTTDRVYKKAITHEAAMGTITGLAGRQFDPQIIEAFLARERQFHRIAISMHSEIAVRIPIS